MFPKMKHKAMLNVLLLVFRRCRINGQRKQKKWEGRSSDKRGESDRKTNRNRNRKAKVWVSGLEGDWAGCDMA